VTFAIADAHRGQLAEISAGAERSAAALSYRPPPRELDLAEATALLSAADDETQLVIGLLLCGVPIERVAALRRGDVDAWVGIVSLPPPHPRTVPLPEALRAGFERLLAKGGALDEPVWRGADGTRRTRTDLEDLIACAAHDAGLAEPHQVTGNTIRHSYLAYLVRQGMRLTDLENVSGPLPPDVLAAYAAYSPAGTALPRDRIDTLYPALRPGSLRR
jgi:integrase